jgi:hypothetical protein
MYASVRRVGDFKWNEWLQGEEVVEKLVMFIRVDSDSVEAAHSKMNCLLKHRISTQNQRIAF